MGCRQQLLCRLAPQLLRRWLCGICKASCSCGSAPPVLLLLVFMFMCAGEGPRVRSWVAGCVHVEVHGNQPFMADRSELLPLLLVTACCAPSNHKIF